MKLEKIQIEVEIPENTIIEEIADMDVEFTERLDKFINEYKNEFPQASIKLTIKG